jgi:hypothetical protein
MTRSTNRITLCAIAALCVAVSRARAEQTCSLADETARGAVETALRNREFDLESGSVWFFDSDELPSDCTDCGNANPASTYGCPRFANERFRERRRASSSSRRAETSAGARPRRDESAAASRRARAAADVSATLPRLDSPNIDLARLNATSRDVIPETCEWPLADEDVIVLYGCVPSRMKYFALTPYLYRLGVSGALVFASLGDSLAMAENDDVGAFTRLSTSASPNVAPGTFRRMQHAPWHASFAVVAGRNRALVERAASALRARDIEVNVFGVAAPPEPESTFSMLFRGAVPANASEWKAYTSSPPMSALRLKPMFIAPTDPYASSTPLLARRTVDETPLTGARDALVSAVRARVALAPGETSSASPSPRPQLVSDSSSACVISFTNCGGDNRDTNYIRSTSFTLSSMDDIVYAVGASHVETSNAHYMSLALYSRARRLAVVSVEDQVFRRSAVAWLPSQDESEAAKLYVVAFARDCARHVVPVGSPCVNVPLDDVFPGVALSDSIELWERPYCAYDTTIGPWWRQMLLPTLVRAVPAPTSNAFFANLFNSF